MRIGLYIADGLEQIILTPEDDAEKAILGKLPDGSMTFEIRKGQFYAGRDGLMHSAAAAYSSRVPDSTYLYLPRKNAHTVE